MTDEELREQLAALEHEQWAHWTKYMLDNADTSPVPDGIGGGVHIYKEAVDRWRKQIKTPYADLTEKEKDSDREWADKVLALMTQRKTHEALVNELCNLFDWSDRSALHALMHVTNAVLGLRVDLTVERERREKAEDRLAGYEEAYAAQDAEGREVRAKKKKLLTTELEGEG
jgi:hypothetical protein